MEKADQEFLSSSQQQGQNAGPAGGSTANPPASQAGGGLFGGTAAQTSQPSQGGSLFGGTTSQSQPAGGGLFGTTQQSNTGSLFGQSTANAPASQPAPSSSLFGGLGQSSQSQQPSLFGGANKPENKPAGSTSVFGLSAYPAAQVPSLLQSTQYSQSQAPAPFVGKLSMGQGNAPQQTAPVGGVKIHLNELRGTTRFQDCIEDLQQQFEKADKMIQEQEQFCRNIQAFLGKHQENIDSLEPSVNAIKDKADTVEATLAEDAHAVEARRKVAEADRKDFDRCQRVIENQKLPAGYQTASAASYPRFVPSTASAPDASGSDQDAYDTDLIGHYFVPVATELQKQLDAYAASLAEIEGHMNVIEASSVSQAQTLAARRAGVNGNGVQGEDTVRELADTLVGFEQSILGVAGRVGVCREGVNELVLGHLQGSRGMW